MRGHRFGGIYSDPRHVIHYTSNDEVRQEFSIVLTANRLDGMPATSSESTSVEWVGPGNLTSYQMHPSMQARVERYLSGRSMWPELK